MGSALVALAKPRSEIVKTEASGGKEGDDYEVCRKKALIRAKKAGKGKKDEFVRGVAQCRDEHPLAAMLVECKRQALIDNKGADAAGLKEVLGQCRKEMASLAFNTKQAVPFALAHDKLFFAGVGLNEARKVTPDSERGGDFGNFSCNNLDKAMTAPGAEEYILFGNEPKVFPPLDELLEDQVKKALKLTPKKDGDESYFESAIMGRIYPDKKKRNVAYFPSAYCHFDRKLGSRYDGIKVYYLIDRQKMTATPYFGAAFFRTVDTDETAETLAAKVTEVLGKGYSTRTNKKGVVFVTKAALKEQDAEGDPLNLCQTPRLHEYLALVKPTKNGKRPEVLILSNIGNLCKYGDRIAARVMKKGAD